MTKKQTLIIQDEILVNKIYLIRGQKVMIDRDLAELYGVETKVLKQAVKRNSTRFPVDFMFEMTADEYISSRSQFVTLKRGENLKYLPYAFTEQGVTMLSSVLNSKRAIEINIRIVRLFIRLREVIISNKEILIKLEQLENKLGKHDEEIDEIFNVLRSLVNPEIEPRKVVGYKWEKEN